MIRIDSNNVLRYYNFVIKSFADTEMEMVFLRQFSRRLPPEIQRNILRKLLILDAAQGINDLRIPPSNHLEKLHGQDDNRYSIRINDQWRVCFRWQQNDAYDIQVMDYHKG